MLHIDLNRCRIGKEHVCPICGRTFTVPYTTRKYQGGHSQWVYQYREGNKKIYLCRYDCYIEATKERKGSNMI